MRDGNSETETELQAAERRISKIPRCGAARVASMEQSFLALLEAIGEDPKREGLVRTPARAAHAFEFLDRRLQAKSGRTNQQCAFRVRSQRDHSGQRH